MFHVETEFFSWNFLSWAINFLLAALAVFVAGIALKGRRGPFFTKGGECGEDEPVFFMSAFEERFAMLRKRTVDIWLGYPLVAAAPLFFLALLLAALFGK